MAIKSVVPSALLFLAFIGESFAQGILTPPGAPAPTMKTLDQIEARTPIGTPGQVTTTTIYITAPGSYVLTGPIAVSSVSGIRIETSDVSLDLNGFTISSTNAEGTAYGVHVNGIRSNIQIRNGQIRGQTTYADGVFSGSGFGAGILALNAQNILVENVQVMGIASMGIYCNPPASTVRNCAAYIVGETGIYGGIIQHCLAMNCGGVGISGNIVTESIGKSTHSGSGIYATLSMNCQGASSSGSGIYATWAAIACSGSSTSGSGLFAATASNCSGASSTGKGLEAYTARDCIGSSSSAIGLYAYATATNCHATSTSGAGITCTIASACKASSGGTGTAISATTITDCQGNASGNGNGLSAYTVSNSYGTSSSGTGILARNVSNSYGSSTSGPHGIYANGTAFACQGSRTDGTAIWARIAVACTAGSGTISANHKELSTE